jgi:hypothetical protein
MARNKGARIKMALSSTSAAAVFTSLAVATQQGSTPKSPDGAI